MPLYSHSRLETFRKCARQFYYRYIAKLPQDDAPEHIITFLGSRCHETLEYLYKEVRRRRLPAIDQTIGYFQERWEEEWTDDVVIHDLEMTPAIYQEIGTDCIAGYYRRYQPFDQARTIGLERRVVFPLDRQGRHKMLGYIDRLAKTNDGVWQVHDYKTNKELPTQQDKDRVRSWPTTRSASARCGLTPSRWNCIGTSCATTRRSSRRAPPPRWRNSAAKRST